MFSGSNALAFYIMVLGNALGAPINFIERLKNRLHLRQAYSEDESDVIIAFVPIVSRAGTDIEAALQKIEASRPVVLVVLHHTFNKDNVAPESKWSVKREGVFAADFLFNEDEGLLRCLRNDNALKSITDYLISLGASPNAMLVPTKRCRQCSCKQITFIILFLLILGGVIVIFIDCFGKL